MTDSSVKKATRVLNERNSALAQKKINLSTVKCPKFIPRETKTSLRRKALVNCKPPMEFIPKQKKESMQALNNDHHFACKTPVYVRRQKLTMSFKDSQKVDSNFTSFDHKTETLVKGLDSWLDKHGKALLCSNLKGVTSAMINSDDSDALKKKSVFVESPEESESDENSPPPNEKTILLAGALEDLRNLILMGFPLEDSEEWLSAIKSCYYGVTYEPLYWECLSLIRNSMPQIQTPRDDENLSKQIEDLEKKLETLAVTSPLPRPFNVNSGKHNRVLGEIDPNNFLPSNSINFAISADRKGSQGSYVVTPVKRSNRRRSTVPNEIVCSSYFDINVDVRKQAVFKPNPQLDIE